MFGDAGSKYKMLMFRKCYRNSPIRRKLFVIKTIAYAEHALHVGSHFSRKIAMY